MSRIPFPPELLMFIGIDFFVAMSLLSALLEKMFPVALPYVYQIAALAGFGQIWVDYAFLFPYFDTRFWICLLYLSAALLNIGALNLYIAVAKKLLSVAGIFLGAFAIPAFSISLLFISSFVNGLSIPMPWLPIIPIESLYGVLFCCIVVLSLSIAVYIQPNMLKRRKEVKG